MSADASNIDEILATTRSVRRRIDFTRAVDPALLLECIDLAVQAPTGVGGETWRFVVVTDAEKKRAIAALYRRAFDDYTATRNTEQAASGAAPENLSPNYRFLADRLQDFPALVVVCREGRPPENLPRQLAFYGSVLPAAWSLMLALRARGLGATWTTLLSACEAEAAALLNMPAEATVAVLLPVGHVHNAVLRRAERLPALDVTFWDSWGERRGA
ncbi:MAG: nitroreductase family protein [Gammaproteobacteria bacterium]|jgi:nitroreductase